MTHRDLAASRCGHATFRNRVSCDATRRAARLVLSRRLICSKRASVRPHQFRSRGCGRMSRAWLDTQLSRKQSLVDAVSSFESRAAISSNTSSQHSEMPSFRLWLSIPLCSTVPAFAERSKTPKETMKRCFQRRKRSLHASSTHLHAISRDGPNPERYDFCKVPAAVTRVSGPTHPASARRDPSDVIEQGPQC